MSEARRGLVFALLAYGMWGLFPLYWPLLAPASAYEMVAHRIVWTAVFMVLVVLAWKRRHSLLAMWRDQRTRNWVLLAGVLITFNWTTYVWALINHRVVETALGYFINPIVTIVFGVVLFRERLRPLQWLALALGTAAVLVMTFGYGQVPWVALILACSFGTYGLCKKKANAGAVESLTLESAMIAPFAFAYLVALTGAGESHFTSGNGWHTALLVSTGLVTAIPLLCFTAAATRVPMVTLGIVQYCAPLIQFGLGVWYFHEPMPPERWAGFGLVWLAIALITVESVVNYRRTRGLLVPPVKPVAPAASRPT